ncbi:MAG TPA: universal stress protein [Candidatus Limnocylindrales bacterium]
MNKRRVLVAFDGTEQSFWALQQAADAATWSEAEIGVVTVLPPIIDAPGHALRFLREYGLEPRMHVRVSASAVDEISRVASEGAYDTVYVGRRDPNERSADASVSRGVSLSAPFSVLIAR